MSVGCATPAHFVPGPYVMGLPVHDWSADEYAVIEKEHEPPLGGPHVHALQSRVSSTCVKNVCFTP